MESTSCSGSTADSEKAWYVLTLLLRLGRHCRPEELAARCSFFNLSPELVVYLCFIPDSPLQLTIDTFITVSGGAFSALGEFLWKVIPFVPRITFKVPPNYGKKRLWNEVVWTYSRKRKGLKTRWDLFPPEKRRLISHAKSVGAEVIEKKMDETCQLCLDSSAGDGIRPISSKVYIGAADIMSKDANFAPVNTLVLQDASGTLEQVGTTSPLRLDYVFSHNGLEITNQKMIAIDTDIKSNLEEIKDRELLESVKLPEYQQNRAFNIKMELDPCVINEVVEVPDSEDCLPERSRGTEDAGTTEHFHCKEGSNLYDICELRENAVQTGQLLNRDSVLRSQMHNNKTKAFLPADDEISFKMDNPAEALVLEPLPTPQQPGTCIDNQKTIHNESSIPGTQIHSHPLYDHNIDDSPKQLNHFEREKKLFSAKQKLKRSRDNNVPGKDHRADSTCKVPKNLLETKMFPNFESFIVEEEEGSGGYGAVYRAQRKHDGKTVAVKCPHANARVHHVNNELKMLERFGGRNFIIKYEGSFRSGNSECFVLEHVEHDRPEVLKREIDIYELQWYGYCMFRALASLHKQGIVHRDVKPGNFLFSRKLNKGYLIDFNLAQDLHHKYLTNSKSKMKSDRYSDLPFSDSQDIASKQVKQGMNGKLLEYLRSLKESVRDSKLGLDARNTKRRANAAQLKNSVVLCSRNKPSNLAGDAAGITPTSTRTPSVDRLKEPIPCQGRKELINLVQEAMQGPHEAVSAPASQRKRVAAPLGKGDWKLVFPTPMPLHSNGIIYGAGHVKTTGDEKPKREGPCVGTKGFRAPEVLFKSPHQGPKVDIWSAGVTLLYLMIGRTPFVGEPEQNIKDNAKLRGCEDLWEVAKIHNRESSFPVDLYDIQSLPPMELREWRKLNTRRLDFFGCIPGSLFDLVDKCLTANPRLRIDAEEAPRHEFFAPCHDALRKQRMLRQATGSESRSSSVRTSSS